MQGDSLGLCCYHARGCSDSTVTVFFFLEPAMRGRGFGNLLMDRAIDFCKKKCYERVFLWTFSTLMAARHLYRSRGFRITDTHENTDWGEKILEERWDLAL
ncbi:GNAT family N-acetyltransferase [Methanoregula sp.]|uniref:GNAT family N-acetyltransferase n=1 Tax=Methanoregula sp. TaxID=2052170 RepID=UPI003C73FACC